MDNVLKILAIFAAGTFFGAGVSQYESHQKELQVAADAVQHAASQASITATIAEASANESIEFAERGKEQNEQVRTIRASRGPGCAVANDYRLLLNAAASSDSEEPVPKAASTPDGGASGAEVTVNDVIGSVVENYTTCQIIRSDFMSLQEWVREQEALSQQQE